MDAVIKKCVVCNKTSTGVSQTIVMATDETGPQHWCRSCYNTSIKHNPDDTRAHHGPTPERTKDPALYQWRKDSALKSVRSFLSLKAHGKMAIA